MWIRALPELSCNPNAIKLAKIAEVSPIIPGINSVSFSYRSPIVLLSFSYRSPIVLLSFSYRSPIILLSFSYRSPIILLLGNGKQYGNNTESNERRTNEVRRSKGG